MGKTKPNGKPLYTFVSPFHGNNTSSKTTKIAPGNSQKLQNLIASHVSGSSKHAKQNKITPQRHYNFNVKEHKDKPTDILFSSAGRTSDYSKPKVNCAGKQGSTYLSPDVLHVRKGFCDSVFDFKSQTKEEKERKDKSIEKRKVQLQVLGTIFKMKNELRIIKERRGKLQENLHKMKSMQEE